LWIAAALAGCASSASPPTTLTTDGAWCWFVDPRGVHLVGDRDCTYVGWINSPGDIVVVQFDHASGRTVASAVRAELEKDDHANHVLLAGLAGHLTPRRPGGVPPERHARVYFARTSSASRALALVVLAVAVVIVRCMTTFLRRTLLGALLVAVSACGATPYDGPTRPIRYAGSSTIAQFIRDAQGVFPRSRIELDTSGESAGGEAAILAGQTDLAGVAGHPQGRPLPAEVRSAVVGRDAIAVIVNTGMGIDSISLTDLRRIFTGELRNWRELTGLDLAIRPLIVGTSSATRRVFRESVFGARDYAHCEAVTPDAAIIDRVARTPGAIGHISFSFLRGSQGVRPLTVAGEAPTVTNFSYPIARPLHLLWRADDSVVSAFVHWALSAAGQKLIMRHFVANRVVGVTPQTGVGVAMGYLVVITETYPVYDGGIHYYPHRPYDLLTRQGELIQHVRNHHSENDEKPMRVALAPGTYLVRPFSAKGSNAPFFVTVEAGKAASVVAPKWP
jgi:phosphate transport system substrate-binding protein